MTDRAGRLEPSSKKELASGSEQRIHVIDQSEELCRGSLEAFNIACLIHSCSILLKNRSIISQHLTSDVHKVIAIAIAASKHFVARYEHLPSLDQVLFLIMSLRVGCSAWILLERRTACEDRLLATVVHCILICRRHYDLPCLESSLIE